MKAGVHNITMEEYVMDPCPTPSLSSSVAIELLEKSPAHARLLHPRMERPPQNEWSSAANFGSAVHTLVFGGPAIVQVHANNWQTKIAKEAREQALLSGMIPLLVDDFDRATQVAAHADVALNSLASEWEFEQTFLWQRGPVWLRCRTDAVTPDLRTIVDLKTTGTNARDANRQFFAQGYDMQAAFLEAGADSVDPSSARGRKIYYLFAETEPPFASSILEVTESVLIIARKKRIAATNLWRKCLETGVWPSYPTTPMMAARPSWSEYAWLMREEMDSTIDIEDHP